MSVNEPDTTTDIQQFAGLVVEIGHFALPPGAMVEQTNVTCEQRGVLQTRPGLRPVEFDS